MGESPTTGFDEAERMAERCALLLQRLKIKVDADSQFQRAVGLLPTIRAVFEGHASAEVDIANLGHDIQDSLGTMHLVRLVLSREGHPDFEKLVPHLRLLSEGNTSTATRSPSIDRAATKIFELVVALAAMGSGKNLLLDHPVKSSKGTNPDVLIDLPLGGRWGFACKELSSTSAETLFQRLKEGAEQLEASEAKNGMVALSIKNLVPHAAILPTRISEHGVVELGTVSGPLALRDVIDGELERRGTALAERIGKEALFEELRAWKRAIPRCSCQCSRWARTSSTIVFNRSFYARTGIMQFAPLTERMVEMLALLNVGFRGQ